MVKGLTDISKMSDGNRAKRKAIDRDHIHAQDFLTQTIKVADIIDNSFSIIEHDAKFAKVYMKEKVDLLLGMDADEDLLMVAWEIVFKYYEENKEELDE